MSQCHRLLFASLVAVIAPAGIAFADDCSAVTAAMLVVAKTPYSETLTRPAADGKPALTGHVVQTSTTKYVETNGRWMAMDVSIQDMVDTVNEDIKSGGLKCRRVGDDPVNGHAAVAYEVEDNKDGTSITSKLWIGSDQRILRADTKTARGAYTALYDYEHVDPPKGVTPVNRK